MLGNDQFDVVILGMGTDGHTASLFPQAADLAALLDAQNPNCCAVVDPITAPINGEFNVVWVIECRSIILHVTGSAKREVLEQALGYSVIAHRLDIAAGTSATGDMHRPTA